MANLTFTNFLNEVYDHCGLDSTDTNNQTRVKRWVNFTHQYICSLRPWTFLRSRENIASVADYTTGTATVNSGATSVTGTSTVWTAAMVGYYIQFSGANDWYKITARASNTAITIETAYAPTANASAVTYIIRKFFYSLSSSADKIVDIRNWNTPLKIIQVDARTIDDLRPNPQSTNPPYGYIPWGVDSSNNIQIMFYPFPTDARLFEIRTIIRSTDMVADGDLPNIPNKWSHIISFGALSVGFMYLRQKENAMIWDERFWKGVKLMQEQDRPTEDLQSMLRSIDSVQRAKWLQMPENYPIVTSG